MRLLLAALLLAGVFYAETKIVLLGTGTPIPNPDRSGPATAIVVNETPYLVDAGPGLLRRAVQAARNGVKGLSERAENLRFVFFTHLHSDHTAGFPDLLLTPWTMRRAQPLEAYGPRGLKSMAEHLLKAYDIEIKFRLDNPKYGGAPLPENGWRINAHEVRPGVIHKDANVTISAFATSHGEWETFGYRFETRDRTIVIPGDTNPSDNTIAACNGCDVLIHETYTLAAFSKASPGAQGILKTLHTSTEALAALATKARPRLLIIHHMTGAASTKEAVLREIGERYSGKVIVGNDLDVF